MLRRAVCRLALVAPGLAASGGSAPAAAQAHFAAAGALLSLGQLPPVGSSRCLAAHARAHLVLQQQQAGPGTLLQVQQPLQQLAGGLAAAAAAHLRGSGWHSGQQPQQQQQWLQWQQRRGLLGVVRHKNYQDHNKQRPPKYKIKTPSAVRRRVIVGEDGTMWRMQAGRRHKRYKKGRRQLADLKGMVPLHRADAAKLRKLGYKRRWWYSMKA